MSDQSSIALAMAMYPSPVDPAVLDETFFSHEVDYLPLFADDSTPFGSAAALDAGYGDPQTLFEPMEIDQLFAPQVEAPEDTSANVSSTFHPDFTHQGQIADIVLVSSDLVHFYVVSQVLQEKSANMFAHHLPAIDNLAVMMPMAASALNVLLHAIYSISPEKYAPTAADIGQAVAAMNTYGLSPVELITPSSTLFQVIARSALSAPFECYSIAASAELEELAVTVSQYTLSKKLWELTDDVGEQIGPQYLKRLFFLHLGRIEALKRLVFPPPGPHPPTDDCSLPEQRKLARAWTLAIGYMTWESRPDLPLSSIEGVLRPLDQQLTCPVCREYLDQRIRKLMVEWSLVKRTI